MEQALVDICLEFGAQGDVVDWLRTRLAELADAQRELACLRSDYHSLLLEADDHFAA